MKRILAYAKKFGYTRYTSTLEEAWRLSISGLTNSLTDALNAHTDTPELSPDEDFYNEPLTEFGVIEAQRHRKRGVTIAMFFGLMKYYRQVYLDLLKEQSPFPETIEQDTYFVIRSFDRIEVAFCDEWCLHLGSRFGCQACSGELVGITA